jgi:carbamoyltransferase
VHLDGTARLQTVGVADDPALAELLRAYHEQSSMPVLCNISANVADRSFLPDAKSAMVWGGVDYVWCENVLYTRGSSAEALS